MNVRALPTLKRVAALLAVPLVMAAAALWTYDCHLHSKNDHAHARQVNNFGFALENYAQVHPQLPGPTLRDAVEALQRFESETAQDFRVNWTSYLQNRTVWGGAFVYEWEAPGYKVTLRSTGRNGRDEGGEGDDLQVTVRVDDRRQPAPSPP